MFLDEVGFDNREMEYVYVTPLLPFYFDPTYVIPFNIAIKDTDETVVEMIVQRLFVNPFSIS